MVHDAFEYSEKYSTPVILRPTTRVCHSYSGINRRYGCRSEIKKGFCKNEGWFCLPHLSYLNHIKVEKRFLELGEKFDEYRHNTSAGIGKILIIASGVSYAYVQEAISMMKLDANEYKIVKISTIPFPENLIYEALIGVEQVVVIEELDAVIERHLYYLCARKGIKTPNVYGKISGDIKIAGENDVNQIYELLNTVFDKKIVAVVKNENDINGRKISFCAGCPHRASFYVVKTALKKYRAVFCGDIGCYTLGRMAPLNMLDTCLCMGAGITIGLGIQLKNSDKKVVSFIGDSTFFHTGIQGIINAVYNNYNILIVILDNSSTAMTGGQPTPEIGAENTQDSNKISIEQILKGIGIVNLVTVSPLNFDEAVNNIKEMVDLDGVKVIIFKAPCKRIHTTKRKIQINNDNCISCGLCISEIGCPALSMKNNKIHISEDCNGCGLCANICRKNAIEIM